MLQEGEFLIMKDRQIEMNPNPVIRYLRKLPEEFTRADLIKFIEGNNVEAVNFRYIGGDGRLKTLNFVIHSKAQLDQLLRAGERVDGSSLFSYIDEASSDLYVIPRYKTAYVNPFSTIPTLDLLCSYYSKDGVRLPSSPENILRRAAEILEDSTGLSMEAMGELEYYVLSNRQYLYPTAAQGGYQESSPFCKWENLRYESMKAIASTGGNVKYGHSEVGHITIEDREIEQNEIEFNPVPVEDAADQLVIAKWILRMLGHKYGVAVSFAPKISIGHAGSGFHIHTKMVKDGMNMMVEGNELSDVARRSIAGYLSLAPSLTAFGNTIPLSYLRLGSQQEAPTNICWSDINRSVLVRVPLGWRNISDMIGNTEQQEGEEPLPYTDHQTVELRSPDGSANVHLLLAGMAVAARHGLEMEGALKLAEKLYVDVNIFDSEYKDIQKGLPQLPASCWESADCLIKDRAIYERDGVFSPVVIDGMASRLKNYEDKGLSLKCYGNEEETKKLVDEYLYYG